MDAKEHLKKKKKKKKKTKTSSYSVTNFKLGFSSLFFFILFSEGLITRYEVSRSVWPYMLSIGLAYFVTLCLFPGIESEVVSCRLGTWMPVIMMAAFNTSDVIGKVSRHLRR